MSDSRVTMLSSLIRKEDLDIEEAETHNIVSLETKTNVKTRKPTRNRWKSMMKQVSKKRLSVDQPQDVRRKNKPAAILNAIRRKSEKKADVDNNPLYNSIGLLDDGSDNEVIKYNTNDDLNTNEDRESTPLASSSAYYGTLRASEVQERFTQSVKEKNSFIHQAAKILCLCNCELFLSYIFHYIICSPLMIAAVPMFILSLVLYYRFGDPILRFLNPVGTAITLSWWLNFWGRQIVLFELSRVTQWIVIDCVILGTKVTKLLGPYVTLVSLQARGFPFIMISWAILDMILLHGTSPFHVHWLYWTNFSIYSKDNSGAFILSSDLYLRVLLSMILIGIATTTKRVVVAIRFGKRLLAEFKPRMEELLTNIVLMNEIAILSDLIQAADNEDDQSSSNTISSRRERGPGSISPHLTPPLPTGVSFMMDQDISWTNKETKKRGEINLPKQPNVKSLLDRWEDPVENTNDESRVSTIYDVLKFKRALGYMDEAYPFGESFGPAGDRDEVIESAHRIFFQLTKIYEKDDDRLLGFDVIALIANGENGTQQAAKLHALKQLFRPDARKQLNLLTFVQSCDNLYKRLRYFRASVSNSSAIDSVLESMINLVFGVVISIVVLSLMKMNPYTLLVSTTSIVVSFAFALGPSVSGFVEGLILITSSRPFDLGDRIVIVGSESSEKPFPIESYFVEDISLMKTTLRHAKSNEVSTINNSAISKSRIINYQRSANATIFLELKFSISAVFKDDKHLKYRSYLEDFVQENTRYWECLVFMSHGEFNADWGFVTFYFSFRHRSSWQNAPMILKHQSELQRFMHEKGVELGIHYSTPLPKRTFYDYGGSHGLLLVPERG